MAPIISIRGLTKTYAGGFQALKGVDLDIERGEILALLGPNGAGKTTLIGAVCGLVNPTSGTVTVDGFDTQADYRETRKRIGLVPQELSTDAFESVFATVSFSRGLFGLRRNDAKIDAILKEFSLADKRDNRVMQLSGGMKRRVMIAKALAHEPRILFLDEPTAGVDVELRKGMWQAIRGLQAEGVTVILTTHYIEEAEDMADRVAVIDKGQILLVDEKSRLMRRFGKKQLTVELTESLDTPPPDLVGFDVTLEDKGRRLVCAYDAEAAPDTAQRLLGALIAAGVGFRDVETAQSSLEEIFVDLIADKNGHGADAADRSEPVETEREDA